MLNKIDLTSSSRIFTEKHYTNSLPLDWRKSTLPQVSLLFNLLAAAAPVAAKTGPAPAAAKEEPKEEVAQVNIGNVFGDDDDY